MKTHTKIHRLPWFGPATIIFLLLLGQGAEVATAQIYTLGVPDTVPWTDTGIYLTAGSQLDIAATGTVHYSTSSYQVCDANGGDYSGAQFLSDMMLPTTVCHSLVGKIGGTTGVGTGTPVSEGILGDGPGFVGTFYNKAVSTSGELFLGFNDDPAVFWDNSGSFSVTISITSVPEPGTIALFATGAIGLLALGWQRRRLATQQTDSASDKSPVPL